MSSLRPLAWFLLWGVVGCRPQTGQTARGPEGFAVPLLSQAPSTAQRPAPHSPDTALRVFPSFVGRYAFAPRIALERPDSLSERDYVGGSALGRLEASDSLSTDGLEVLADYPRTLFDTPPGDSVAYPTYPVYVANATPRTKYVYGWGSGVYAIQEAVDRAGVWRPIERVGDAWCNMGNWALALRPRRFVVFLARKHGGSFATRLRIRLQNGESRYVSRPYPGRIDERLFTVSRKDYLTLANNNLAFQLLFLGAKPVASDSIGARQWRKSDEYRLFWKSLSQ
jgi:hypothetical protein